jgi:hypothetical protein
VSVPTVEDEAVASELLPELPSELVGAAERHQRASVRLTLVSETLSHAAIGRWRVRKRILT